MLALKYFKLISKALYTLFKELPDPNWALSKIMSPSGIMMANSKFQKSGIHSSYTQSNCVFVYVVASHPQMIKTDVIHTVPHELWLH